MSQLLAPDSPVLDTIIVSDVHLGSDVSRAEMLVETLRRLRFNRLILLGDIFDDLNFKRLRKEHWKLLSHLRKLSKPGRVEVVWIRGNHDEQVFELISCLLGVEACDEYLFEIAGRRCLALHGHQFDKFLTDNPLISKIAAETYLYIQRWDTRNYTLSRRVKKLSKGWLRNTQRVAMRALKHAAQHDAQAIFCGHTHQSIEVRDGERTYYNTGCWTEAAATLMAIDVNGAIVRQIVSRASSGDVQMTPATEGFFKMNEAAHIGDAVNCRRLFQPNEEFVAIAPGCAE